MIDNYNELDLGTYLQVNDIIEGDGEDIDKQVRIIALLASLPVDDILALPLADYAQLAAQTVFLREVPDVPTAPSRVIVGDRVYIPTADFTKITTAQYVDFQTFVKGGTQTFPQLLGVLLVPEGCAYNDGYDIAKVVDDIKTLPVPVALALVGFFFDRLHALIADSLTSLTDRLKDLPRKERKALKAKIDEARRQISGAGLQI